MISLQNLFLYLVITFLTVLYLCYKLLTRYYNYWSNRNVPHKKPILFFGTNKDHLVGNLNVGQMALEHYKAFPNEPLVGAFQSRWPELVIRDPEIIKNVLVKDFQHFIYREKPFHYDSEPILNNLFHLNSERWKLLRNKMSPAFTSGKLKNMFPLITERGNDLRLHLIDEVKESAILEIRDIMAKYTTDVIGSCAFGIEMNSMKDSDAPFRQIGKVIFESGLKKIARSTLRGSFPELATFLKVRLFKPEVFTFMSNLIKEILDQRENKPSSRKDFIDIMIEIKNSGHITGQSFGKKNESNDIVDIEINDDIVVAQAFIFFAAGFETSSTATSFALYELALNNDIQEKLFNEITSVLSNYNGILTYESLNEMKYLEMVINESLRKYPPLSVLTRECTLPYSFPETNIKVDTDCSIVIPVLALHRDPKYYPDPEIFDPDRFLPEACQSRHPFVYLPFGEGPRNCIGARFGRVQSMVGLISMVKNFKFSVCEKTEKYIEWEPSSYVTSPKRGIWLKLEKRPNQCAF